MKRPLVSLLGLTAVGVATFAVAGCDAILGFGSFTVGGTDGGKLPDAARDVFTRDGGHDVGVGKETSTPHDAGADHVTTVDATCPVPTSRPTFESACTTATCEPFMESRVPLFDGGLRPLPTPGTPDAGGTTDASSRDGSHDSSVDAGPVYPACPTTNVVYATGSSALATLLGDVAQALVGQISFVYQTTSSCVGVQAMLDPSFLMTGAATSFATTSAGTNCSLPAAGVAADIGIADVFAGTCQELTNGLPADVKENFGPVQVMTFAVPTTSSQESISLAAAYDVFGFGSQSGVPPWTNASYILQRTSSSGTQNMIGATIGVPSGQWLGVMHASTGSMVAALIAAGKEDAGIPSETIGILVAGSADTNRSSLRVLAFQDDDQACGYFPDSTATAHDKYNVRNGHYPIWGPSHFYNRVAGSMPLNANAQTFIDDLSGITPLPGVDLLALYAQNSVIPTCAMHVQRSSDGAGYEAYTPPTSCNCYYDFQATGATSCTGCTGPSECPMTAPVCNKFNNLPTGYCEPE
jgi:hypothetical protein